MKKPLLFALLCLSALLILGNEAKAQTWSLLSSGVTNDLNDIACPSESICYVVGGAPFIGGLGIVLKTTNGGDSWTTQSLPTTNPLRGIHCPTTLLCYAAGDGGVILKTINGGATWVRQTVPNLSTFPGQNQPWFWDIWAPTANTAIAVGNIGAVYRTTNGGETWTQMVLGLESHNLAGIFFVNETTGWLVGAPGLIHKTTNAGASWTAYTADTGSPALAFSDVFSLDGTTVWASGPFSFVNQSTNGGTSWTRRSVPPAGGFPEIEFADSQNGWLAGNGAIEKTTDGGQTWTVETLPRLTFYRGLKCFSSGLCYAVGDDGTILRKAAPAPDTTPPSIPETIARTSVETDTTPTITWPASTDNVGVTSYEVTVLVSATQVVVVAPADIGNVLTYTVPEATALPAGQSYDFRVRAKDAAGNRSAWRDRAYTISAPVAPAPGVDTTPPAAPTTLRRTTPDSDTTPTFTWLPSPSADVTSYYADISETTMGTNVWSQDIGNVLTYTVPPASALTPGPTTYIFHLRAKDAAGNISTPITHAFVVATAAAAPAPAADSTPPGAPGTPAVSLPLTDTTPTFTWTAATDNVGVTGYLVVIGSGATTIGVGVAELGNVLTYTVPDSAPLQTGVTYLFSIRARDAAGNLGSWQNVTFVLSAPAAAVAADTTAPAPPTGLRLTSADDDTTPSFSWVAATDNVGVTSYEVKFEDLTGFVDIGNVLTYTHSTALPAGASYHFMVRAKDAAGNVGRSASLNFTLTPAGQPAPEEEPTEEQPAPNLTFGRTVRLTATSLSFEIVNAGEEDADATTLVLQWRDENSQPLGDQAIMTISPLAAGARRNFNILYSRRGADPVRNYVFRTVPGRATALSLAISPEADEELEASETTRLVARPLPDLVLRRVAFSTRMLRFELRNQRSGSIGAWAIGLEWLDESGAAVGTEQIESPALPGLANRQITVTPTRATNATADRNVREALFRTPPAGAVKLKVVLDPANAIAEVNERNNALSIAVPASLIR